MSYANNRNFKPLQPNQQDKAWIEERIRLEEQHNYTFKNAGGGFVDIMYQNLKLKKEPVHLIRLQVHSLGSSDRKNFFTAFAKLSVLSIKLGIEQGKTEFSERLYELASFCCTEE